MRALQKCKALFLSYNLYFQIKIFLKLSVKDVIFSMIFVTFS